MNSWQTKLLCTASVIALSATAAQAEDVDWTGAYAGASVGFVSGEADIKDAAGTALSPDIDGVAAGGQAGFNFQDGIFVFGVEGDFQLTNADGNEADREDIFFTGKAASNTVTTRKEVGLDWIATLRGRAGVTAGDFLVYGTAGIALADLDIEKTVQTDVFFFGKLGGTTATVQSASNIEIGWTAGGGIEGQITPDISARIQALYVDLGSNDVFGHSVDTQFTIVNFGVNFKLGGE